MEAKGIGMSGRIQLSPRGTKLISLAVVAYNPLSFRIFVHWFTDYLAHEWDGKDIRTLRFDPGSRDECNIEIEYIQAVYPDPWPDD